MLTKRSTYYHAIIIALLLPLACSDWKPVRCNDGMLCPLGYSCTEEGDTCQLGTCGNRVVEPNETCDDGNHKSGDGCRADCKTNEQCGNNFMDDHEVCDWSIMPCRFDCTSTMGCGDEHVTFGEDCDKGDTTPGDGCSSTCKIEFCGNGIKDLGEACDKSDGTATGYCSEDCRSDGSCGNHIIDLALGEECDDGNTEILDDCHACKTTSCGDGREDAGEECDCGKNQGHLGPHCTEPNSLLGGYCRPDCVKHCGDGLVADGEQCDGDQSVAMYCADIIHEGVAYDMGIATGCQECAIEITGCDRLAWWEWASVPTLRPPPSRALHGVFGFSWDEVFAVGDSQLILHFHDDDDDDDSPPVWHDESPTGPVAPYTLFGVWGYNADNVLAVGSQGTILKRQQNGSWATSLSPPGEVDLYAISGNDMYTVVVGASGKIFRRSTTSDGGWSDISPSPPLDKNLYSVWIGHDNTILIAGASGTLGRRRQDGEWENLSIPEDSDIDFYDIWGNSDDAFVVGGAGTIVRIGKDDKPENMSAPFDARILSIWGIDRDNILSVGRDGKIFHYDGTSWSPVRSQTNDDLLSIWLAKPAGTIAVAVGAHGGIYRFAYPKPPSSDAAERVK